MESFAATGVKPGAEGVDRFYVCSDVCLDLAKRGAAVRNARTFRRLPVVELALVFAGTMLAIGVSIWTGLSQSLDTLIQSGTPLRGIADIGPGLLVLSCGLGTISVRRWLDSEREQQRLGMAQRELRHSEARYRSLVELSPDPVIVATEQGIVYVNRAAVTFFGASGPDDLIGMHFLDRIPIDLREDAQHQLDRVATTGETGDPVEQPFLRLDGSLAQAERAMVSTEFEGRPAIQVVVRDLTARHAADEAALRYRALAENSQDVVYFAAPDGRILDCNRAALLQYGYTKDEMLSRTVLDLRAPGTDYPTGVQLAVRPGDTAKFDTVHARKDGSLVEFSVTAQRISLGEEEFVVTICRDVTDKRRALRELQASETRYRSLIEVSPSPMAACDMDGRFVFANTAMLELLRARNVDEVVGHTCDTFIHPDSVEAMRHCWELLRAGEATPFSELKMVRPDGSNVVTEVAATRTVFDGHDAIQIVLQDVSHLKGIADTLRRTTEETISAMARLAETRDPYTSGHQERVAEIASRIAIRLGLPDPTCEAIRLAGTVHDIGKMSVPAEILSKPGPLTEAEFDIIKGHADRGYEVLRPIDFPWPIADIVRQHHERLDGSGYPLGLRGDEIRIEARVIAVADTVEAISSHRPYRPALGLDHALRAIQEGRGTLYDPDCVDACVQLAMENALFPDTGEPTPWAA
jgi:PAS domain S-box-containing protein/putative nucleotidyltransferase with HDIG domain